MKFTCPVCKAAGEIQEHEGAADQPATQTTCPKCGAALSVEHSTGRVRKQSAVESPAPSRTPSKYAASSVLSMQPQDNGRKDYLAMAIFALVLVVLIAGGVYFSLNINRNVWNRPLQMISRLVDDVSHYGKRIWEEFQKKQQPRDRQTRESRNHVRKGYEHYKEDRFKKALAELNLAIETHPENPEAYFWRARTFIRLEQYDSAIADLQALVNLNPRYAPAYDNLGWLYMRRSDYDESLASLNKSIELKPDNGWAHHMRGRVYFNKGDIQKALENARAACKLGYKEGCRDAGRYESKLSRNN